ncbi:hypothetical protein PLICRDRAFT_82529, partial [Plicaturopsis crispa FD-325 SS-3]
EHSATLAGADSAVNALAFSSTGQFLASGDDAGVIAIYEGPSWTCQRRYLSENGRVRCLAWHPQQLSLMAGTSSGGIHTILPDLGTDGIQDVHAVASTVDALDITTDGSQCAIAFGGR